MKQILRACPLFLVCAAATWAGALYLQVGNPETVPEAKAMKALLVAQVTACHEPAKSVVSASAIEVSGKETRRTPLQVIALKQPGFFAVIGSAPEGSVIDIAVKNPEYKNYEPRVLIRERGKGVDLASAKHFFSTPPNEADVSQMFDATR